MISQNENGCNIYKKKKKAEKKLLNRNIRYLATILHVYVMYRSVLYQ